jgi:hypothetical protein
MGAQAISGNESSEELLVKSDSGDSFTVDARAVARFVSRYLEEQVSATELEQIADLLESAEFFEYVGPGADGIIAQVVFEMSGSHDGAISMAAAERWLRLLTD